MMLQIRAGVVTSEPEVWTPFATEKVANVTKRADVFSEVLSHIHGQ